MRRAARIWMVLATAALALCGPAATSLAQNAEAESRPLSHKSGVENQPVSSRNPGASSGVPQTLLALALVIGLVYVLRLVLRKGRAGASTAQPQDAQLLHVLARTNVSAKHQLCLVQMGRRLVLIGCSPQGIAQLAEVTDVQEIQQLVQAAEAARSKSFGGLLRQKISSFTVPGKGGTAVGQTAEKLRSRLEGGEKQ